MNEADLMIKRSESSDFGPASWQRPGLSEQAFWLGGSSRAWRAAEKQEPSAKEAVVASCAAPKMVILTMLSRRDPP